MNPSPSVPISLDALLASRERDALVAEKIFGAPCFQSLEGEWVYEHALGPIPPYSTSIGVAWEMVEKLLSEWTFSLHSPSDNMRLWTATFYARDEKRYAAWHADTAPLAIWGAALKAVGVTDGT